MYFWKIKSLKQEIEESTLSTKDEWLYLGAFSLLYFMLFVQGVLQISRLWNIEMVLFQVAIAFGGITYIFFQNGALDGKDFLKKLSSVGWVFLLRSLFFMSIGMLNLFVMTHLFDVEDLFSAKNSIIIGMLFEVLLYWRIGKHIRSLR